MHAEGLVEGLCGQEDAGNVRPDGRGNGSLRQRMQAPCHQVTVETPLPLISTGAHAVLVDSAVSL